MAYLGKTPSQAVRSRYYYTATGGETSLSGADDNANTLTFTDGNYVDVALNGVTLVAGTDYNTTTANTIGGLTALVASDVVEVIVYDTFSVFSGNVNGDFTVGGTLTAASYSGLPTTTLTSLGIANHDDITVDGLGNVGIGTTSPNSYAGYTVLTLDNATNGGIIDIERNGTLVGEVFTDDVNTFTLQAVGSKSVNFRTNGLERLRIDSSGNVGVGISSPLSRFQVSQSANLSLTNSDAQMRIEGNGYTGFFGLDGTSFQIGQNSNLRSMTFHSGSGMPERMRIDSSGNVGIGSSSPEARLHVEGASTGQMMFRTSGSSVNKWLIGKNSSADFSVGEDGNEWLYVQRDSGNVGIADNNPTQKLSVNGHIKVDAGSTGYIQGPTGEMLIGEDTSGLYIGTGFGVNPSIPFYIGNANTSSHNFRLGGSGGGNNVLVIDSSGRVTMPYQPSFAASRNQGDVTNAVYVYTNQFHNTGGHYNNSNGRFTAPVTGSYFISANHMSSNSTYNNYPYHIRVNGSVFQLVYNSNTGNVHHRWNWHGVIYLQAGDYVDVFIPAGLVIYGGSNLYTHFSGYLIG